MLKEALKEINWDYVIYRGALENALMRDDAIYMQVAESEDPTEFFADYTDEELEEMILKLWKKPRVKGHTIILQLYVVGTIGYAFEVYDALDNTVQSGINKRPATKEEKEKAYRIWMNVVKEASK